MAHKPPELHLIIIWHRGLSITDRVIEHLNSIPHLTILNRYKVTWSQKKVKENFTRFYGIKLHSAQGKIRECGTGSFHLITLLDTHPVYDYCDTSRGHEYVNTTLFSIKQLFRSWSGGGHKIHTTNTPKETDHDLALLLGKNSADYLNSLSVSPDVISYDNDLVGAWGWDTLASLFYTLNATTSYVVLRNYETLPHQFSSDIHGDIDLLVDQFNDVFLITNAQKKYPALYRVHCKVMVGGKPIFFDFRYIGDDYYCADWQRDIVQSRTQYGDIYVPNTTHLFYSLVYHALIHKKRISPDYYDTLNVLFQSQFQSLPPAQHPFDYYADLLIAFLKNMHYGTPRPFDQSVRFNEYIFNMYQHKKVLQADFGLTNVTHCFLDHSYGGDYCYFTAKTSDGESCFIKWGGLEDSVRREYLNSVRLRSDQFCRALYYRYNPECKYVVLSAIEGITLEHAKQANLLCTYDKFQIYLDLVQISETLLKKNIIHRDIKPNNVMLSPDSRLIVIDFQFCLQLGVDTDFYSVIKVPHKVKKLGDDFAVDDYFWDDQVSLLKLLEYIGYDSSTENAYRLAYEKISLSVGKLTFQYKPGIFLKRVGRFSSSAPSVGTLSS